MKPAVQLTRLALSCSATIAETNVNRIPRFLHLVCAKQIRETDQSLSLQMFFSAKIYHYC